MNPVRWLASRLANYAYKATPSPRGLMLVANWLANQLWNIDATWRSLIKDAYGVNAIAYACVRLLSQSVPEARLTAYMGEGKDREELPSTHPLRLLLNHPNELMTRFEMDELTTIHMAAVGRSVWWKERANSGQVIALWPLRPDRVGPDYSASDRPGERVIQGYAYLPPNGTQPILIPRRDALAFNFPDPDGESGGIVEGFGSLSAARSQIAADNQATKHVGALLANYAQPGVVLTIQDTVDEETARLIKMKFRQEFGGDNLGLPGLAMNGAKVEQLGFNLEQLEFPELRANAEARICACLGIPTMLVGVRAGLEASTFSNMASARAYFAETTLSHYWRRYADQYTNDLATEFGEDITCEYDTSEVRALAGQKIERITPVREAFLSGVVTRNQYLHTLGLDPLEPAEGDVFLVPNSVTVVPATDKARAAIENRKQVEQRAIVGQQEAQPQLPAPAAIPQLPAPRPNGQQAEVQPIQPGNGTAQKALSELVVIPLDDELAAALVGFGGNGRRA